VKTVIASIAVLAGAGFMLVAGLGLARLPDLYTRMHAATKPASVGVVAIMSGVAFAFHDLPVTARAALVALFFLLTAPVAAHAVARTAHALRVPLAPGTRVEDGEAARERDGPRERRRAGSERRLARGRLDPGEDATERQRVPQASAAQEEDRP
jgi:multicomponent Na+:H+ antiporter subunit G